MDVAVLRVVKTTYAVLCLSLLGGMSVFYESIFFADNKQEFKIPDYYECFRIEGFKCECIIWTLHKLSVKVVYVIFSQFIEKDKNLVDIFSSTKKNDKGLKRNGM